jgi:site-specific recombinase XerD
MALTLADRELIDVSTEDLRDVIDTWAMQSARTRQKVTSVIRSFWGWAEEQGHIAISPAARIRRPRAERRVARTLPLDARPRLLVAAKHSRDRLGLFCLLVLGVRRADSPVSRSATSTRSVASCACSARARRSGCCRCPDRSLPSCA